jgi:hypothetical protein
VSVAGFLVVALDASLPMGINVREELCHLQMQDGCLVLAYIQVYMYGVVFVSMHFGGLGRYVLGFVQGWQDVED